MEVDEKVHKAWFADFEKNMKAEKRDDIVIPYNKLSLVFPTNHTVQDTLDVIAINTHALEKWATDHGWFVRFAHENADPKHKSTPPINFSRTKKN